MNCFCGAAVHGYGLCHSHYRRWKRWGTPFGGRTPNGFGWLTEQGYTKITRDGRQQRAHRYTWEATYGPIPVGMELHHKNGVRSDNRLSNLQLVSRQEHTRIHRG
jgi:hypothetical protein